MFTVHKQNVAKPVGEISAPTENHLLHIASKQLPS